MKDIAYAQTVACKTNELVLEDKFDAQTASTTQNFEINELSLYDKFYITL